MPVGQVATGKNKIPEELDDNSGNPQQEIHANPVLEYQRLKKRKQAPTDKNLTYLMIGIIIIFGIYHSFYLYQDHQVKNHEKTLKGKKCLTQFHVMNCSPINLTDQCSKLAECFQESDNEEEAIGLTMELAQKTTRSLSQTLAGPLLIIIAYVAIKTLKNNER